MTAKRAVHAQMRMRNDAGGHAAMVDRIRLQAAGKKGGKMTGRSVSGAVFHGRANRAAAPTPLAQIRILL